MPLVGFEPTISAGEQPQTYAVDRAATGTGAYTVIKCIIIIFCILSCIFYLGVVIFREFQMERNVCKHKSALFVKCVAHTCMYATFAAR